jgi:Family of unknown function (DUF6807)
MMIATLLGTLSVFVTAAPVVDFPHVQTVPMPDQQIAFEVGGREIARYHYGPSVHTPFVFPLIGPAGRRLTRLTHPHDPDGHGHHLSIWVAHRDVNESNFWEHTNPARIAHQAIEKLTDGASGSVSVRNAWLDAEGTPILSERRTTALRPLADGESYLDTTIELAPADGDVTFGKTSFGFFAVRVAKTMSVNDGGGVLRNSEGGVGEKALFWKHARWVDYSGRVTPDTVNGITLLDHPGNPRHPAAYHVRGDGWMGASFCVEEPYVLKKGDTLRLRYRLYAHAARSPEQIDAHWKQFAEE